MRCDSERHEECALEVGIHRLVPVALGLVERHIRRDANDKPCRIDKHIDVTKALDDLADGALHRFTLADVGTQPGYKRAEPFRRLPQWPLAPPEYDDMCVPPCERLSNGLAHSRA